MKIHIRYDKDEDTVEFYELKSYISISNLLDIFTEPETLEYISDTAAYKAKALRKMEEYKND